jgi:hypothetical protein
VLLTSFLLRTGEAAVRRASPSALVPRKTGSVIGGIRRADAQALRCGMMRPRTSRSRG